MRAIQQAILTELSYAPKTVLDLSVLLGKSTGYVDNMMRELADEGRVAVIGRRCVGSGRPWNLWGCRHG